MKKPLLSALGLAVALAFSMPVLGNAAATTAAAPAATAPAKAAPKKVAAKKACKVTKTHKCPVKHKKHKKHTAKAAAAKKAAPKTSY
ncbi:hypothetical protein EN828_23730 [Mesorhizobium sp. M2D.F.Ca.ET.185.01.1.1]|uniref:hypothetical protein n=1 Tax=unclassified Mesorhizobium TaxID=325217 RepID=UPI000FCC1763|nr:MULTISPECIES: hypothetical protein [unclassified Mesorhizobium]TGP77185.1 hypothetical protein EN870_21525 [bacterium M00.F.Ca.ET.227.01.1.1]TGP84555.1 hypothetical protein EN864_30240 [bacterium M00.F.Ca.ET.221.01.1.1]TGP88702.1 hypothetical protein EN865_27180 [bacterium M00.F.Ca.ET.222.01.1.1]TGT98166.1 hypothetical protein EN806_47610 [bacterium M00.F.Ca.ET.163.01.1.1]TGU30933.1 hypothetical protein EN799_31590 [bacterium M00.F.Ca.ET.156.01.1.1]TGU45189.1 hypothetical protein EN789_213